MSPKPLIYDLNYEELNAHLDSWQEPNYRVQQIWEGLYQQFWQSPQEFSQIPKHLRKKLETHFAFSRLISDKVIESADRQTLKTLFKLPDDQAVEAVLMRYDKRRTLCISTQAGCAMGCVFCATGQMGFRRNLTSGEIIEQVLYYARHLAQKDEKVTNVVVMGMGEPFHNYDSTLKALKQLNHPNGFNFSARRFTISTVGLIPAIKQFAQEQNQINLAISLHAADDELRSSMLPVNDRYPLQDLIQACREYVDITGRRITFEWALIHQVNDTADQAHKFGKLLHGMNCHVNIIPLNPTEGFSGSGSTEERVIQFQTILETYHIPCTVRLRRGIEIQAGCGQLAAQT
ncbi:23S rRNA (adenine(2503)-C(2))-methyltransferase RlmN [Chloroflexota bacterium]